MTATQAVIAILAPFEIALLAHEVGHALTVTALGYRPRLRLTRLGIGISHNAPLEASCWIALAGPFGSFILALIALTIGWRDIGLVSALIGATSLLPLPHHDGVKVARALRGVRA